MVSSPEELSEALQLIEDLHCFAWGKCCHASSSEAQGGFGRVVIREVSTKTQISPKGTHGRHIVYASPQPDSLWTLSHSFHKARFRLAVKTAPSFLFSLEDCMLRLTFLKHEALSSRPAGSGPSRKRQATLGNRLLVLKVWA